MFERRAIAWITSLWLVLCGVLGAHHEARAAHFVDGHGLAFHASGMAGEHTASHSDVHSRDAAIDHDACGIAGAMHPPGCVALPPRASRSQLHVAELATCAWTSAITVTETFRIAPKTSPPTIA